MVKYSIIIPCRDRPADLARAIGSCRAQTFTDFEVIVIDDFSTEDVQSVCASFACERIRYFRNERNYGVSRSRNEGVAAAQGRYILFLDSDDQYLPHKLARVEAALTEHSQAGVLFHAQRRLLSERKSHTIPSRAPRPDERLDEFILLNGNHVQTNSYIVRRDIANAVRFDETCSLFEDTKFIVECAFAAGGYVFIDETLSIYYDKNADARLSKLIDERTMEIFSSFVCNRCSAAAAAGFFASMCGYISFWKSPLRVVGGLWSGFAHGVSAKRTAFYFLRSGIGAPTINRILARMRQ